MKKLETLVPPPVYTFSFIVLTYVVDTFVRFGHVNSTIIHHIGLMFIVIAFLYGISAVRSFFRSHTTADPTRPERTTSLVTSGVYRYTRNPMYVAMATLLTGYSLALGNILTLMFPIFFVMIITRFQIIPEERVMVEKFNQEYQTYKNKVRRWL